MSPEDDDDIPFADPAIRTDYEAALGLFILVFNEVDYRLSLRALSSERICALSVVPTAVPSCNCPNDTAVDTQGSACCRRRLLRADIDHQVCDFFGCREAIKQRRGAHRF